MRQTLRNLGLDAIPEPIVEGTVLRNNPMTLALKNTGDSLTAASRTSPAAVPSRPTLASFDHPAPMLKAQDWSPTTNCRHRAEELSLTVIKIGDGEPSCGGDFQMDHVVVTAQWQQY